MCLIIEDIQKIVEDVFGFFRIKMMGLSGEFFYFFLFNIIIVDIFMWDLLKFNIKKRYRIKVGLEFGYDYLIQVLILILLVIFDEVYFFFEDELMVIVFLLVIEFFIFQKVFIVVMIVILLEVYRGIFEKYVKKNGYNFYVLCF